MNKENNSTETNGLTHRPFEALQIRTWGQALARCRVDRNLSHNDVANRVGVKVQLVREWESDQAVPTRPHLARLHNVCFRQLKHFTTLLPEELRRPPLVKVSSPEEGYVAPEPKPIPPILQRRLSPPADPRAFGPALRRCRLEEGLSIDELADVMCVTGSAVRNWENSISRPCLPNYEKLVQLLPALSNAPKPRGMRPWNVSTGMAAAKAVLAQTPAPALPEVVPTSTPPLPAEDPIEAAAARYTQAVKARRQRSEELSRVRLMIRQLESDLTRAVEEERAAHDAMMAAAEPGNSPE